MVDYKPVKITINTPGLAKVIMNVVVRHHSLLDSIVTDWGCYLSQNSGHCYAISLASSGNSPPLSIHS